VWFAIFYAGKVERADSGILESFTVQKAGFLADDLVSDLNLMLGTVIDMNRASDVMLLRFQDKL